MPNDSAPISFELRVIQNALNLVISEEDAESLAQLIIRLLGQSDAWADPNITQGHQIALKALICDEVMRVYKIQAGQITAENGKGDKRSFANIYREISSADSALAQDAAWNDYVKYSPANFKLELLQGLESKLVAFKDLGPLS